MSEPTEAGFQDPEHIRRYLRDMGYGLPLDPMDEHIRVRDGWMAARGAFYDYKDTDGFERIYEVHRRSLHPASWVCADNEGQRGIGLGGLDAHELAICGLRMTQENDAGMTQDGDNVSYERRAAGISG